MKQDNSWMWVIVLVGLVLLNGGIDLSSLVPGSQRPTAVTYVYEKDTGGVPGFIGSGLDRLNRLDPPIMATAFEEDTVNSATATIPTQYKIPREAAIKAGLPALVVQSGERVLKVVKDPKPADIEALP